MCELTVMVRSVTRGILYFQNVIQFTVHVQNAFFIGGHKERATFPAPDFHENNKCSVKLRKEFVCRISRKSIGQKIITIGFHQTHMSLQEVAVMNLRVP
jgi:hypothetical protein